MGEKADTDVLSLLPCSRSGRSESDPRVRAQRIVDGADPNPPGESVAFVAGLLEVIQRRAVIAERNVDEYEMERRDILPARHSRLQLRAHRERVGAAARGGVGPAQEREV